jgi:hypothetical protein
VQAVDSMIQIDSMIFKDDFHIFSEALPAARDAQYDATYASHEMFSSEVQHVLLW